MDYIEAHADLVADSDQFGNEVVGVDEAHPANIRISRRPDGLGHYLFLDLDVPHEYVPSSTPGHAHLIVDVALTEAAMNDILDLLAQHGIVQKGYADGTARRGVASLRLPHVKKEVKA